MRTPLLLLSLLLLAACGSDRPGDRATSFPAEAATSTGPGSAAEGAVAGEGVYDSDRYRPEGVDAARNTLLQDTAVREGQVLVQNDTVRVTAVVEGLEGAVVRQKAEQFAVLAARELEAGPQATTAETTLGPTRMPYLVVIRDRAGNTLYSGIKAPGASELTPAPAFGGGR